MHGQENHAHVRQVLLELDERVDAVERWHRDVGDHEVGLEFLRRTHHGAAVLDDGGELELVGEQALQSLGDDAMVIGQQDARFVHARADRLRQLVRSHRDGESGR